MGHGGERGRATRPCDRQHAGPGPCDRSGTRPCRRRYLNCRPGACCSSAPAPPRARQRAWRRMHVRLRCARLTSGAFRFELAKETRDLRARWEGWMGGDTCLLLAPPVPDEELGVECTCNCGAHGSHQGALISSCKTFKIIGLARCGICARERVGWRGGGHPLRIQVPGIRP